MGTKSHFQSREKYFIMEYNRKYCEKCYSHFGVESIYWKIMSNLAYLSTFHCMKHMWVMPSLRSGKRFKSQTQNTKDQAGKKKEEEKETTSTTEILKYYSSQNCFTNKGKNLIT